MKQEIIDLYDEFTHRGLDRRVFMSRLADLAGGTAAAATALSMLRANPAGAAMVAPDDPRLDADTVTIREGTPAAAGLPGAPGGVRREASGGRGRAREPRPQPAHPGRCAPARH